MARESIKIVRLREGESGVLRPLTEAKALELAALVAGGETNEDKLSKKADMDYFEVKRAMRSKEVQALIREEVRARALMEMPSVLEARIKDAKFGDPRVRSMASEFVLKAALGEDKVQVNQIQSWDPSQDEQLFERARTMFSQCAAEVVERVLESGDDEDKATR